MRIKLNSNPVVMAFAVSLPGPQDKWGRAAGPGHPLARDADVAISFCSEFSILLLLFPGEGL